MATFESSLNPTLIYIFAIEDERHKDCVKIGETTFSEDGSIPAANSALLNEAAHKRIRQYTQTAGIHYQLLHTELTAYFKDGKIHTFNDKEVHSVLDRSGIKRKEFKGATEWYCCDLETAKKAIAAVKQGRQSLNTTEISTGQNPIIFRPEQAEAIEKTKDRYKKGHQMLWNAKMRFGKTLCALQVAKELAMKRTLIVTHRPVVDAGWFEDFGKIFYDRPQYHYGSKDKGETFASLERLAKGEGSYVYFASMQDMRGSMQVGGKFDKNDQIFSTAWDFLIIDEAHEGTRTELGQAVIEHLKGEHTKVLRLSGTPFNLLDDHKEEEIFTWDYVMEQRAKIDWEITHLGDTNPYASLPAIHIYTYDLGRLMSDYSDDEKAFNFREFFRTREDGTFVHNRDIDRFLNLLCQEDENALYPYSNDAFRKIFRHTLWILPGVRAARALSRKLQEHPIFGAFTVVNVAGDGDEEEESRDALELVNKAIGADPDLTYTITLSCGRLTTGVSVKPWTGVFMMAGAYSTSAASYMQTIFRVQTPYTHNGRMKTECYAFDFAPDRTLRVLAESAKVSAKAGKQSEEDRKILTDFLNFCPIIAIEGSQMKPYDVNTMMGQLKRAQIEKVVQCGFEDGALYNDELLKLTEVELNDFNELKAAIGKTKAMPRPGDIDINKQGLTNEQYAEKERLEKKKKNDLSPEEKQRLEELKALGNQRREAIAILRGISIRMPLLLYGAEMSNEEEELTLDNFENLIDDTSWEEFMPRGVSKEVVQRCKRYYDPDIFREAGKRIREMARMADKFTIEERISRIAAIFATFRNPDKETVLTPWRVVNMHLSDCLGGYCFMDRAFEQPLEQPRYVDQKGVTQEVFTPKRVILEINSKSGLYPLYAAYSIYRARMEDAKEKYGEVSHPFALQLWDMTLEENILVVCKTPMARSITRRTLAGFRDTTVHAEYYPDLIENISKQPESVVNMLQDGKRFWKINSKTYMKIDTIIGNPPYQVMDGGAGAEDAAAPIYHKFVILSKQLNARFISLIMPSKWMIGGRSELVPFLEEMKNDLHLAYIKDYRNDRSIFPTAHNDGGICYFLWDKNKTKKEIVYTYVTMEGEEVNGGTQLHNNFSDYVVRDMRVLPILEKIHLQNSSKFSEIVSKTRPFGLRKDIFNNPEKYPRSLLAFEPFRDSIKVFGVKGKKGGAKRIQGYITKEDITDKYNALDKYKLFFTTTYSSDAVTPPKYIKGYPKDICTETFLLIGTFQREEEMDHCGKYMDTSFFRFLLFLGHGTMQVNQKVFSLVPLQDFTTSSDINWSESIENIDKQLYVKYNLTGDEIAFIERMIKSME